MSNIASEPRGKMDSHKSTPQRANVRGRDNEGSTPPMPTKPSSTLPTQVSLTRSAALTAGSVA